MNHNKKEHLKTNNNKKKKRKRKRNKETQHDIREPRMGPVPFLLALCNRVDACASAWTPGEGGSKTKEISRQGGGKGNGKLREKKKKKKKPEPTRN